MGTRTEVTIRPGELVKPIRPVPFVLVAPAAVMLLGAAITLPLLLLGAAEFDRRAHDTAAFRARTLAGALAARLEHTAAQRRPSTINRAANAEGTSAILLSQSGRVIHRSKSASISNSQARALMSESVGEIGERGRDAHYVVVDVGAPLVRAESGGAVVEPRRLVVLAQVPSTSNAKRGLITSLASFATLLLGAAGIVAWAMARDVHSDVLYLRKLIVGMADERREDTMKPIPVRTIDQVGQLTASFNHLLERFRAAERAYRQDLTQANAFDKDRAAFLSALSHELRTPLNAILGFTDVLLSEIDGPLSDDARENLTIVRTSGEHLRSLIDDILALGALESGQFRLSREDLDIGSVAQDVVTEVGVTAKQKKISLELALPDAAPPVARADRRRVRQILQNVISNAVKFTARGGVTVTVRRDGNSILTTVLDTGPGIEREALENIFNEFEQAGSSNVQRQGTGLGLSITRRLVQMHGGAVRAESELGKGSVFTVRLPVEERQRTSADHLVPRLEEPLIREAE